jgi:4-hydroxyphenylpyruvate dioxygenase
MQQTPAAYYDLVERRLPRHGEPLDDLRRLGILIDGTTAPPDGAAASGAASGAELLLQIFTQPAIGPIFFELIQRKGNEGFGEGNFRALFESIELDQIRRGVLAPSR